MLHEKNLRKSMTNDQHLIAFLKAYRDRTRQELAQPYHIDFRAGGIANREISRQYGKPYDTVFMRMLSWAVSTSGQEGWEIYIPGSTIKGAFRRRASQILKTLWGESARTTEVLNALFGMQGQRGLVFFSDAYLADPQVPERSWCSMDGVKMNPRTGQPIEEAKADYLFAYGDTLSFALRLDIQDIAAQSLEALSILRHLLQDFQKGDIPLGGEKTCGFGWVEAVLSKLQWKTTDPDGISTRLFGKQPLTQEGIWYRLNLEGEAAQNAWQSIAPLGLETPKPLSELPKAHQGFISHRAFGGYCGTLAIEAMVLTPLLIRESGEPSYQTTLGGEPVYGWDFFSLAPPKADLRDSRRNYALPSKSIKGMIRHLYTIASGSSRPSPDISHLNPTASLFGWVGNGPNQSLMGRVSFSFGLFTKPELAWFKIPYPYGTWQYTGNQWQNVPRSSAPLLLIGQNWRIFPHAPLAPCVERLSDFRPETAQADYGRAILPGAQCRFTVRFWNLEKEELQRLLWCLVLEKGLAHKMGKGRYLGFGSLRLRLLPESFLIDWTTRYASMPSQNGRLPLQVDEWINTTVIQYYAELQQALYAEHL
jgi:CRISPR/Cas system CSM-associated protein Csm3 (group 7 of RAMP superfamily)